MKRLMSFLLIFTFIIGFIEATPLKANSFTNIMSVEIDSDSVDYAMEIFPKHLHGLLKTGDLSGNVGEYSLGQAFSIFNVISKTYIYCFPLLKNNDIKAILEVSKDGNIYNSSLSISFSKKLVELLKSDSFSNIFLLTDGVHIQAFDGNVSKEIFSLYGDERGYIDLSVNFDIQRAGLNKISLNNLTTKQNVVTSSEYQDKGAVEPTSYKILNVRGVSQSGKTCWAATCAALINFYKNLNLTDIDVARAVFGDAWDQGAGWNEIERAYNSWYLYPSQTIAIYFDKIKSNINKEKPMNLILQSENNRHSLGLIGYEEWTDLSYWGNSKILILLEPNGGIHRSVTLNSSGTFDYELGKGDYKWIKTIEF